MSKLFIAQLVFVFVLFIAAVALGAEIFVGHMNPDVILPWAYVAAASWMGWLICAILRLSDWFRTKKSERNE